MGNERSTSSSSGSSRKSKKNNSEKPNKQPQRGLGVAQLEKIRLHSEMGANYLHNNINPYHATNNLITQDSMERRRKKDRSDSIGSNSQNSESNGCQELDLELRL
ncbi:hypothetical protein HAX54_033139 [Datura stramonium]|uniref:Protein SPEAR3-like n=1 Tax=Datura stramonium TaxID=4076 RepID=A0ABS8VCV8_DATST|nr:hypothetical protein [Datura stramonium]